MPEPKGFLKWSSPLAPLDGGPPVPYITAPMGAALHLRLRDALALILIAGASACGLAGPSPAPPPSGGPQQASRRPASTPTQLLLRLSERRLYVVDTENRTPVESFPIAIGKKGWETPVGRYAVEEMVEHPDFVKLDPAMPTRVLKRFPPGPTNPLGQRWIGFAHGENWTLGIHGTPNPELLGQAVSHGCVRMRNEDVVRVYDRVKLGTVVTVEP
jgi:L,D-transpeptidase ErfK/SrfK